MTKIKQKPITLYILFYSVLTNITMVTNQCRFDSRIQLILCNQNLQWCLARSWLKQWPFLLILPLADTGPVWLRCANKVAYLFVNTINKFHPLWSQKMWSHAYTISGSNPSYNLGKLLFCSKICYYKIIN